MLQSLSVTLFAIDTGELPTLALLDFSTAFDTVDNGILPRRLKPSFGSGGLVLVCSRFYQTYRLQHIRRGSSIRCKKDVVWIKTGISAGFTPVCLLHSGPHLLCGGKWFYFSYICRWLLNHQFVVTLDWQANYSRICWHVWSKYTSGWVPTSSSWIRQRPRSSGAPHHSCQQLKHKVMGRLC